MSARSSPLPDTLVVNLHRRYTGVSATVAALLPHQRAVREIGLVDNGGLGLGGEIPLSTALRQGWQRPQHGARRIWHARRDTEMLWGLFARDVLRQPLALVFTSAAPKRHGRVLRTIMGRMDAIIASSERAAGFLDWHSVVVPHGVDTEHFCPADRGRVRAEEGVEGAHVIGAFGRLRPSKGTDLLVDALCALLPDHPRHVALFTGIASAKDQAFLEAQRAKIAAAGLTARIRFLGQVDDARLRRLFQCCEIVVAASRSEGYGLTPLEGGATGAAVVTSNAGVWPWVVDASIGARVQTGSTEALIAGLRPLMADPALALQKGSAARARMVAEHSILNEVAGVEALYQRLANGPVPKRVQSISGTTSGAK